MLNIYASLREEYAGPDGARLIATRDVRLARRITRDWRFRGHDADFTIGLWPHVCKAEDQYIKTFKNRANLVPVSYTHLDVYKRQILNGYDEWDIQQHYAGWVLFRNSHWAFPLGLADTIAAPDGTVISFTDSIPWVSIFFKALRGVLPSTFQWFGWYTLFCFAMQGAAGALLCARGQAKTGAGALVFSTLGGLLFVMLPTLWERAFRHTALAKMCIRDSLCAAL